MFDALKRGTRSNWELRDSNSLVRGIRFLKQCRAISRRDQFGFPRGVQKHLDPEK
jgi:hypothetical protein